MDARGLKTEMRILKRIGKDAINPAELLSYRQRD